MWLAEYAAALDLSPQALRRWRDRFEESGTEIDWRSLLHPSAWAQLSSAASCVRRKYRLTAGFEQLTGNGGIVLTDCWAHTRRKFYDVAQATNAAIAVEALRRIGELYAVEAGVRG